MKDSFMADMKDLNNTFKRLESDFQIVKIVNNNLLNQLDNTERQCWVMLNIYSMSVWRLLTYQN